MNPNESLVISPSTEGFESQSGADVGFDRLEIQQRQRHSDDVHKAALSHQGELQKQQLRHNDEVHKQHLRHRDEAHKQNLGIAKEKKHAYYPPERTGVTGAYIGSFSSGGEDDDDDADDAGDDD